MSAYQPGIPTGLVQLDFDYLNIKNNFGQLDTSFGIDHTAFSIGTNIGYHKTIHQIPFALSPGNTYPAAVAGIGEIFTNQISQVNTDEALFYQSGGGKVAQLTVPMPIQIANFGYTFIPGGLIFQWGFVAGTHGGNSHFNGGDTGSVTFATNNIAFPNKCINVWTSTYYSTTAPSSGSGFGQAQVDNDSLSTTGFNWTFITNSSAYTFFSWYAIGK